LYKRLRDFRTGDFRHQVSAKSRDTQAPTIVTMRKRLPKSTDAQVTTPHKSRSSLQLAPEICDTASDRCSPHCSAHRPGEVGQADNDGGRIRRMADGPPQAIVRIERSGTFGLLRGFEVVVDEAIVGVATRSTPCDVNVPPGVHRVYVRAPRPSKEKSNVVDVDLEPGQMVTLNCRASFPIHKSLGRSLTMGAWKPQILLLSSKLRM